MKSLTIKDLAITEELDVQRMSAVRGGFGYPYVMPSYPSSNTTVTVSQANQQYQSNATGNGSAVFGGSIEAWNTQSAVNYNGSFPGYGIPVRI